MAGNITFVAVLTADERSVLLKYNTGVFETDFDTKEDYENYKRALERLYKARGIVTG